MTPMPKVSCGKKWSETKLSQDPKASECSGINPRVPRETLAEDGREEDKSSATEREEQQGRDSAGFATLKLRLHKTFSYSYE